MMEVTSTTADGWAGSWHTVQVLQIGAVVRTESPQPGKPPPTALLSTTAVAHTSPPFRPSSHRPKTCLQPRSVASVSACRLFLSLLLGRMRAQVSPSSSCLSCFDTRISSARWRRAMSSLGCSSRGASARGCARCRLLCRLGRGGKAQFQVTLSRCCIIADGGPSSSRRARQHTSTSSHPNMASSFK